MQSLQQHIREALKINKNYNGLDSAKNLDKTDAVIGDVFNDPDFSSFLLRLLNTDDKDIIPTLTKFICTDHNERNSFTKNYTRIYSGSNNDVSKCLKSIFFGKLKDLGNHIENFMLLKYNNILANNMKKNMTSLEDYFKDMCKNMTTTEQLTLKDMNYDLYLICSNEYVTLCIYNDDLNRPRRLSVAIFKLDNKSQGTF